MDKNLITFVKVIFGIAVFAAVVFVISKATEESSIDVVVDTEEKSGIDLCFTSYTDGVSSIGGITLQDRYTLKMNLDGEVVKGELSFMPAEKDAKTGSFAGYVSPVDKMMMARTATAMWDTYGEGMNIQEELSIIFGEGTASIGMGEMVDRGDGVYVYKNKDEIVYSLNLTDTDCSVVDEIQTVEKYVRENISSMASKYPALGGTWYVVVQRVDTVNKTVDVVYEDGHIQKNDAFEYFLNDDGTVREVK